ncbi:hypothetical protein Baya_16843 [Bagarius yarrelli]|uniref:Uncharacterized protein n=1 Tax=Bagarius yarrelli TaxID=175774 RepID=A0A556VWU3_BAGYA|nr:hypothetical protein Baya_16843 [Bagarius yarrelli]
MRKITKGNVTIKVLVLGNKRDLHGALDEKELIERITADDNDDTAEDDEGLLEIHSSQQQQQQSMKLCPKDRHIQRMRIGVAEALMNIRN